MNLKIFHEVVELFWWENNWKRNHWKESIVLLITNNAMSMKIFAIYIKPDVHEARCRVNQRCYPNIRLLNVTSQTQMACKYVERQAWKRYTYISIRSSCEFAERHSGIADECVRFTFKMSPTGLRTDTHTHTHTGQEKLQK